METPGNTEIIAEDEVTPENIRNLFKRAFYGASIDDDDDVRIDTDGPLVFVGIRENVKLLRYTTLYGVDESARLESKHAFVNRLNNDVILCRFSISGRDDDTLCADYYLPFGEGILAFQVVSALRWFARIVPNAIRDCDEDNLVK